MKHRQSTILYALVFFLVSLLTIRLVHTQLMDGSVFASLADNNRMYTVYEAEERGVFLDRYNEPLVFNKPVYYKLDSAESLYSERTRIPREEALEIFAQDPDLIRIEHEREYRYPESLAHVLGYIGSVTADDLLEDSSLHISDKIGKLGMEYWYQDMLKGEKGYKEYEINALGEKQHLIAQEEGRSGTNIPTTLDPYLSEVALEAMGDKRGAIVILDGDTGEVLSLVSTPTFDASKLSETSQDEALERERVQAIQSFFSHPQKLFFNRAISGVYPPGSVFKIITSLAGLEGEKIDANTTVEDEGVLEVGEYSYANWYYTQFGGVEGEIDLVRSIARSNDIFFYKVAEWVGPEKLKEMSQLFGFGSKTGIQLQAESSGLLPDPAWKQEVIGERWFLGNTYHMGIGQGDLLVTPIQTAQMMQAISSRGRLCAPTMVSSKFESNQMNRTDRCGEVGVLEENLKLVLSGMLDACSPGGTAFPFFSHNESMRDPQQDPYDELKSGAVACKTGTSEFGIEDSRGYRKTHGWFAATFGTQPLLDELLSDDESVGEIEETASESAELSEDGIDSRLNDMHARWLDRVEENGFPKTLVLVVLVESDEVKEFREGSSDAAPVVKEIFDWMFSM